jgi:hypothetical protein
MNTVAQKIASWEWKYAQQDPAAEAELTQRLIRAASVRDILRYSDLVSGVTFRIPTVNDGREFQIDVHAWTELDRAILGDFLGSIAATSYAKHSFLLSSIAVSKLDGAPTAPFFKWAADLGLLQDNSQSGQLAFWITQTNLTYDHYCV